MKVFFQSVVIIIAMLLGILFVFGVLFPGTGQIVERTSEAWASDYDKAVDYAKQYPEIREQVQRALANDFLSRYEFSRIEAAMYRVKEQRESNANARTTDASR